MTLTYEGIKPSLEQLCVEIDSEGIHPILVAHVGKKSEPIGRHFADYYGCENIYLLSRNAKWWKPFLKRNVNNFLSYFPDPLLFLFSRAYKKMIGNNDGNLPDDFTFPTIDDVNSDGDIFLVDDSVYTGKTLGYWNQRLASHFSMDVHTVTLTHVGEFKPDYCAFEGWHSFSWRPSGV